MVLNKPLSILSREYTIGVKNIKRLKNELTALLKSYERDDSNENIIPKAEANAINGITARGINIKLKDNDILKSNKIGIIISKEIKKGINFTIIETTKNISKGSFTLIIIILDC